MKNSPKKSGFSEVLSQLLIAIALALLIRTGVVQAFYIPSGSMEDTLLVGDYLMANKFVYGAPIDVPGTNISLFRLPALRDPQAGDIVIFRAPVDEGRDLIKRCVAVGGQTVQIVNKVLYVDDQPFQDPPLAKYSDPNYYPAEINPRDHFGPYVVPENHFFMMGDNRDNSEDSRFWGFVPKSHILGQPLITWFSINLNNYIPRLNRIGKIPN